MSKQTIATADFSDANDLAQAIVALLQDIDDQVCYISGSGFHHTGTVFLIEETLTDGSLAYNMEIGERQ